MKVRTVAPYVSATQIAQYLCGIDLLCGVDLRCGVGHGDGEKAERCKALRDEFKAYI
jgi:hypothetical protein